MDFSCLAIDIGAESGRVTALSFEGDGLNFFVLHRFENLQFKKDGHLYWDVDHLFAGIREGLVKARELEAKPVSVGVDTWGVDYVLVDHEGSRVCDAYAYRDPRGDSGLRDILKVLSKQKIYEKTGIQFQPYNSLCQLAAHARQASDDLKNADSFLMMPDYLHFLLSGKSFVEWTNATTTQLVNATEKNWDKDLLEAANIPARLFKPIIQPGTQLGPLHPELAAESGLRDVTVVAPATHDTASAVVAVPHSGDEKGWAFLSSGTWSLMGIEHPCAINTPEALAYNFTNEGGVDGSTRVLKNIMGLWLIQKLRKELSYEKDYAELMSLASTAQPHLFLIDVTDNRFLNPDSMADAIKSFCVQSAQRVPSDLAGLLRCCLDSLALEYRLAREQLELISKRKIERLYIVGGGSANSLLCQMTADACGIPVFAGPVEATAIGNAMIQARAMGKLKTLAEIRSRVASAFEINRYQPAQGQAWEEAAIRYQHLKESIRVKK